MTIPTLTLVFLCLTVFALGVGTGALGLGLAIVGAPALSFFFHQDLALVLPFSLLLNAATCLTATTVFAPRGLVAWRHALRLGLIAAGFAAVGAYAARKVPDYVTWYVFLGAMLFLVGHLLRPPRGHALPKVNWTVLYLGSVPAGVVGGFTGIGPAFALMPGLIVAGMDASHAAGTAALTSFVPSLIAAALLWPDSFGDSVSVLAVFMSAMAGTAIGAGLVVRCGLSLRAQKVFAGFAAVLALVHFFVLR